MRGVHSCEERQEGRHSEEVQEEAFTYHAQARPVSDGWCQPTFVCVCVREGIWSRRCWLPRPSHTHTEACARARQHMRRAVPLSLPRQGKEGPEKRGAGIGRTATAHTRVSGRPPKKTAQQPEANTRAPPSSSARVDVFSLWRGFSTEPPRRMRTRDTHPHAQAHTLKTTYIYISHPLRTHTHKGRGERRPELQRRREGEGGLPYLPCVSALLLVFLSLLTSKFHAARRGKKWRKEKEGDEAVHRDTRQHAQVPLGRALWWGHERPIERFTQDEVTGEGMGKQKMRGWGRGAPPRRAQTALHAVPTAREEMTQESGGE